MGLLHFFRPYTNSTLKQSALYINTSADPAMQHTLDYNARRSLVSSLPWDRERIQTTFEFSTRRHPSPYRLRGNEITEKSLKRIEFDPALPVYVFCHGYFTFNTNEKIYQAIRKNFLKHINCNFIFVDWSKGSVNAYWTSTANSRIVGVELALLLEKLIYFRIEKSKIYLMGHSLGSHIIGYAGQRVPGLQKLLALDPAGPYFEKGRPEIRIDPTDGEFVEVWHTDGRKFLPEIINGLGMWDPAGHVDIYVNGGLSQPTCGSLKPALILFQTFGEKNIFNLGKDVIVCPHQYVLKLIAASFFPTKNCVPVAFQCANYSGFLEGQCTDCGDDTSRCIIFGEGGERYRSLKNSHSWPRRFFLRLDAEQPYCMHHYEMIINLAESVSLLQKNGNLFATVEDTQGGVSSSVQIKLGLSNSERRQVFLLVVPSSICADISVVRLKWMLDSSSPLIIDRSHKPHISLFYMNNIIPTREKSRHIKMFCGENTVLNPNEEQRFFPC
ncbi:pancreatic lipase-related protein 3-like isoform X2 [Varroa jacobsoni]|uniref:pancreatic lipase-related protein 3-like isoform X2 n=1 Tax=Varroa jacobsoni TaxID=62625 RepID=UPI000BF6C954|nr:pancreatic lipase-related protein 3-like isoform X2 [Varroa jacobsoni]